jgi:hypothetical protein
MLGLLTLWSYGRVEEVEIVLPRAPCFGWSQTDHQRQESDGEQQAEAEVVIGEEQEVGYRNRSCRVDEVTWVGEGEVQ